MRKIQTLGIILSVVMLYGSIPLGFAHPIKEQIEEKIEIENMHCYNHKVLVQRYNGKIYCVSEQTAGKTGWNVFSNTKQPIVYDYPLSSKIPLDYDREDISDGFGDDNVEIMISKLPRVGEVANVTITFTNSYESDTLDWFEKGYAVSSNLEFVNITSESTKFRHYVDEPLKVLRQHETETVNFTIKAVAEGKGIISAGAVFGLNSEAVIYMIIGEKETILLKDYRERHSNEMDG